jgi:hypothetical protein
MDLLSLKCHECSTCLQPNQRIHPALVLHSGGDSCSQIASEPLLKLTVLELLDLCNGDQVVSVRSEIWFTLVKCELSSRTYLTLHQHFSKSPFTLYASGVTLVLVVHLNRYPRNQSGQLPLFTRHMHASPVLAPRLGKSATR